ncbi:STAS domain-containing protein [Streptomyces luteolifulvus]|uniref:STAS domain-containing protein n=1 Tax=Streptomyces luteolifulvus TaxID=2615112 RepID=A0A6H9V7H0_9ACTN|nr:MULTISPECIES: STAS domain-containing protein [Streptomyces]KAB1149765.1 STAS domain-containing protein [Streptomyces luteolifulvus]MXM67998.1 anti-sigma factor antagonist [Streptomyces sp. HUCO-GS316]
MTIEWRYTVEQDLGILSVSGYLGPDAVRRFTGAIGWVVGRGAGPVVVDLTGLRGWSAEGQLAIIEAARRLAEGGRSLELAAIPADGSLVPGGDCPPIPVHPDLAAALAGHGTRRGGLPEGRHEWRTTGWPSGDDAGE